MTMIDNNNKCLHEDSSKIALADYVAQSSRSKKFPQYLATILATLGAFSAGTCLSWTSPALPLLEESVQPRITNEQGSWIGALITLGAFTGAIPAGILTNKIGRKRFLQLLAVPVFISWLLIAFSKCIYGMFFARYLAGMAVGAFSVAIPIYVAELSESKIRGTLGSFFQLQITAGILFEYTLGITANLQFLALIPSIVPVLFFLAFNFIPESPVYLCARGRTIEARNALQWFRGDAYDVEDELIRIQEQLNYEQQQQPQEQEKQEQKRGPEIVELIRNGAGCKGMVIALGLMVFQQMSGVNAVIFYTESIFNETGSTLPSFVPAIIIGIVMVIATYISTILIDRAGRRILLLVSSTVMALCLACLSLYFYTRTYSTDYQLPMVVPLLSVAIYITVFSLGFGPIPWIMLGELFTAKLKGTASSISAAFNWLLAFTVTKLFQNVVDAFGSGFTFGLFAVICILGAGFVAFVVPETKGKDIDEIQHILGAQKSSSDGDVVIIDVKQ